MLRSFFATEHSFLKRIPSLHPLRRYLDVHQQAAMRVDGSSPTTDAHASHASPLSTSRIGQNDTPVTSKVV